MKYTVWTKLIALLAFMALFAAWRLDAAAPGSGGEIAYVRDGKEIRLIEPDGTNDRVLWRHPRPDLWVMRVDGSALRLLAKNGRNPSWRRAGAPGA